MVKEKEIEEMAEILYDFGTDKQPNNADYHRADYLINLGYGDVKQYQEEVEKYKGLYVSCYRKMADYHEQVLVEQNTVGKLEDDIKLLKINQEKEKQQAVKEFAEKIKPIIDELVELMFNDYEPNCKVENCEKPDDIPCGCSICVEENKQLWENKIDNLITELYGADK